MYFGFSEEQQMLRASVRRFLEQHCPIQEVRRLHNTPSGYSDILWQKMAQAGWLGVNLPEQYGGLGLGWLDLTVILEELGRGLYPSPFIANSLAAIALCELGTEKQKLDTLPALIDGRSKASLALFDNRPEENSAISPDSIVLRSKRQGNHYLLEGCKRNVLDPESVDLFIVCFRHGDGPDDLALALVNGNTRGLSANAYPLIDQGKRMGLLRLEQVSVESDQVILINRQQFERLIDQGALAISAEIAGSVEAALQITVQYAKDRKQFGHPIGHFQAVKHPLAEIHVDLESFRSLLYYGAYAHDQHKAECSRIASMTKAYATETFIRSATDAIQIHGATGYMTAVDIHLYYLRSKWARPLYGDSAAHYERALAGKLSAMQHGSGAFKIELDLTENEKKFRDEVRDFLTKHNTPVAERNQENFSKWLEAVRQARYIGFAWPRDCGGYGGTIMQQFILKEEMLNANAQMLGTDYTGLGWVGPAIIQFGNEEQKQRFLPPILNSQTAWCTGYSEPDVGSDLAALQCKAQLNAEGTHYLVNGQKIWTSLAHIGTGIYCLVRTAHSEDKHEGITCLLIPLDTPGIEVRPIQSFAGDHFAHLYNEVFFTDVKVPVENRIGQEGDGWKIICGALQNERSGIAEVNRHHKAMDKLIRLARQSTINGKPALENDELRKRLASFDCRIEASRLNGLRALTRQAQGEASDSESSPGKLHNCYLLVAMADTAMELLGSASPYVGKSPASVDKGKWQIASLGWPTTVIGGGTPNIQRNIIAERILGLAKD